MSTRSLIMIQDNGWFISKDSWIIQRSLDEVHSDDFIHNMNDYPECLSIINTRLFGEDIDWKEYLINNKLIRRYDFSNF